MVPHQLLFSILVVHSVHRLRYVVCEMRVKYISTDYLCMRY